MKLISIVTPCYNEEGNVEELYHCVKSIFRTLPQYCYEHIFIDNASTDDTVTILKRLASEDQHLKIIVNSRNFGHVRSPFYALMQANGDAVITLAADLQDPPDLILDFLRQWEKGFKMVVGIKKDTQESFFTATIRRAYYHFITRISELKLIKNFTGFGLYDKVIIQILRDINDVNPYFRGLISEIGFKVAEVPFTQPKRKYGKTKNNFFTLYDLAFLGMTKHSKFPIRLAVIGGFFLSIISMSLAIIFLLMKLFFWESFSNNTAPILIGMFFFASVQLFFMGILGEYLFSLQPQILKRPLVIEEERINFNEH